MNSPRHRVGSRRNKHLPITRQTRVSDLAVMTRAARYEHLIDTARCSTPDAGRLLRAVAGLSYDPAQGSKPSHPFRAVSIDACFGERLPERDSAKAAAARRAGDCGRSAATMTVVARRDAYRRQVGGTWIETARQTRRILHKGRRSGELV